jgi:hypothetical protein
VPLQNECTILRNMLAGVALGAGPTSLHGSFQRMGNL